MSDLPIVIAVPATPTVFMGGNALFTSSLPVFAKVLLDFSLRPSARLADANGPREVGASDRFL
jgi:hypothetical protein